MVMSNAATTEPDTVMVEPIRWIMLKRYCEVTGDTSDAVHARRRKRQWVDGVHCVVDPNGNLRVNPEAVNQWVSQSKA
jgi:hypothetical protein